MSYESLLGKWVEVDIVNGKRWIGVLEEVDEEAVFITNGHPFGHADHKGAECTIGEVASISESVESEFSVE